MANISENEVEKLKDCPFCGSNDILRKFTDNGEHEEAECSDCGAEHNIGMWQIRYAQSAPVDLERVRKILADGIASSYAMKHEKLCEALALLPPKEKE